MRAMIVALLLHQCHIGNNHEKMRTQERLAPSAVAVAEVLHRAHALQTARSTPITRQTKNTDEKNPPRIAGTLCRVIDGVVAGAGDYQSAGDSQAPHHGVDGAAVTSKSEAGGASYRADSRRSARAKKHLTIRQEA
jgi:hypothetical protein